MQKKDFIDNFIMSKPLEWIMFGAFTFVCLQALGMMIFLLYAQIRWVMNWWGLFVAGF